MPARESFRPMLAALARELPEGPGLFYEPKWDGFRCLVFSDGDGVDLRSRHGRPLARYFPEVVPALASLGPGLVLDGELVVRAGDRFDFSALLQRLHPAASRVELLSRTTPASFIAFDGVVVKDESLRYVPGRRRMLKVKRERTADCVVGAFRWHAEERTVGSLLLGLYDGDVLRHAGLAASFGAATRRELTEVLVPRIVPLEGHPWAEGFNVGGGPVGRLPGAASKWAYGREVTFVPVDPQLVCEAAYDHIEHRRFRHPPKFRRWRPDRDPRSCTYDQFTEDAAPLRAILGAG